MRRVLVTGAAGRLGRATLRRLAADGIAATGLDLVAAGGVPVDRMVLGDVTDPAVVRAALAEVDAVVHCAAIPAPTLDTAPRVFGINSLATFVVLEEAARAGIGRAVLAGSLSVLGLAFAKVPLAPAYLPVDTETPLQAADPYALSKQADEATAEMMTRRYGMTVVTLRFPLLGGLGDRLPGFAEAYRQEPWRGAGSFWAYLEDRDAAEAVRLALTGPLTGCHTFTVAAPQTLAARPTEELLETWFPGVPRRAPMPGYAVPVDVTAATRMLGFRPVHLYESDRT